MKKFMNKKLMIILSIILGLYFLLLGMSFFLIPESEVYSCAVYDKNRSLIGAKVSEDGQWRFEKAQVPVKFQKCIIQFEDRRFYFHFGIDIFSIVRAFTYNKKAGRIVSGGSTITMQTVRILKKNPKRTYVQKIKEAFLALALEVRFSKKKILQIYCGNAPFGGNVIGLEAASWRYFYRAPEELSWAECATLAVLPNQPSLVYPGANSEVLLEKRNKLLYRLYKKSYLSLQEYELALLETLPGRPYELPRFAWHYLEYLRKENPKETKFYTSLDSSLQKNLIRTLERWSDNLSKKGINNGAAIILNTQTKEVLAYCGNTAVFTRNINTGAVDLIQAKRSSGSLLKPFLYSAMLDTGQLMPKQLVIDIPTRIGSYRPDNNIPKYTGAVPADEALSRSLNIPAVRELREYGINAFLDFLKKAGFTSLNRSSDEYGLTLILGGGEVSLFETCKAYANMMNSALGIDSNKFPASQGAAYLTLLALCEGNRPEDEANWKNYASGKRIAWKTGTSSGNRDAWAIGTTAEYTVGVWLGNAEGEGRPDLKSASTSAPLLFDIFSFLPMTSWPDLPYLDLKAQNVCKHSGYAAGINCEETERILIPKKTSYEKICPYCKNIYLTPDLKFQASVEDLSNPNAGEYANTFPVVKKQFVLPPNLEYWYSRVNVDYISLPEFVSWHKSPIDDEISIVFPEEEANLIIPVEIDGSKGSILLQAATHSELSTLYWDIDGEFLGFTENRHEIKASPKEGEHILTITDSKGNIKKRRFEIVENPD